MITIEPIGTVRSARTDLADDDWDRITARIELSPDIDPESLRGIEEFSHVEVIFHFDRVVESQIERRSRHPRGNSEWPRVGIFAQRGSRRPNRLGATIAKVVGLEGRTLRVEGLDAVDGTPVLDIKPVMTEFLPRGDLRQPVWSVELMRDYWRRFDPAAGPRPHQPQAGIVRAATYFPVPDVQRIGEHYRDVLGFECEYSAGEPPEFAVYRRGGAAIMFRRVPEPPLICPNERQGGTWDVFCWVDQVDALHEEFGRKGATFVYGPTIQPYGMKEFAVRDPNGYVLGFGQVWPARDPIERA